MNFKEDLASDPVSALPLRDAIAIDKHTVIRGAIALMRTHSLGCAIIVDHRCYPTGIFTEQSVIRTLVAGVSLDATPVSEYSDPYFCVVRASDPIKEAWNAVIRANARFLCVTNDEGELVGLTGQRGIAEYVCDCFASQIPVQRLGSTPWMLHREGA